MAIRGFELGTETDRMFADQERMRREREAGKTEQFAQVEQMIAEGAKPITIKDIGYFGLSVAPVTGDAIAFKDAPEDYHRAYELIQAGYGEKDLIKLGLGGAYSALITMGLIPGLGFISRIGKNALKQLAINSIKKGDTAKGAEILFNTSDFVKKEMKDKLNKNFSTKRQSEIKKIKEQYSGKVKTKMLKRLSNPVKKEVIFHGTAMGQYVKNPKLGTYVDKDYLATDLAQSYNSSSEIFSDLVISNNDNPILDIEKFKGDNIIQFPTLNTRDIDGSPIISLEPVTFEVNKKAGEVYLKGKPRGNNDYNGETFGVVKLVGGNKVDLREVESVLNKKNRDDVKYLESLDEKFVDKIVTKGFDKFDDDKFPQFGDEKSYIGMGTTRKGGEHSELGEKAVSGSLDPVMSSSPAFTSPNEYGGFSDLGMGSDDMGRTIENLVYTEIPYNKFKNMTPEDYDEIVNLYKQDPKLRKLLLDKYKGESFSPKGFKGTKLPKSIHTEAEVAMFSPELKTFKKVKDDPKIFKRVIEGNKAFDRMKGIESKILNIDLAKLTGNKVEQQKAYNTIKDYMNAGIDMGKFTGTGGARGSYDVFLQTNIKDSPKFNSLVSQLAIQLPKGQKKRNMRILSRILDNRFETTKGAVSRVEPFLGGTAQKDFSAKRVINYLGNILDEVDDNLVDFKTQTGFVEMFTPRQIKELIMEITPKLNRGGLMTR